MGFFTNKKKGKAPHTWYTEILHWQEGDKVFCWNILSAMGNKNFWPEWHKYTDTQGGYTKAMFTYQGVDAKGMIYVKDKDDHLLTFEFYRFIKKARNESLLNRQLSSKLEDSEEYMELMKTFQQAFDELQESDNHPKRLGEPQQKSTSNS